MNIRMTIAHLLAPRIEALLGDLEALIEKLQKSVAHYDSIADLHSNMAADHDAAAAAATAAADRAARVAANLKNLVR